MFKNYFKTALRNLWSKKSFSLLNILGLAIGITTASLIFLWVEDEITYSDHFRKKDQLYQIMENQTYDGKTFTFAALPGPFAPAIEKEIPGIKAAARCTWGDHVLFSVQDHSLYADGVQVDPSFVSMFGWEFIKGNPQDALKEPFDIIIHEDLAKKMFNQLEVIGKKLTLDQNQEYTITGVYKSFPPNTRFAKLEFLMPIQNYLKRNTWLQEWGNNSIQTFVELFPEADPTKINEQLKEFITQKNKDAIAKPFLFSAHDWRLRNQFEDGIQTGGRIRFVKLFSLIAWIIILLACINFMNLATARSEQRAREVGVRKVLGSNKTALISQFITESLVLSFISLGVSIGLVYLLLPGFNQLVEKSISFELFKPIHLFSLLGIGLIAGLLAGSYPAFYLSSFRPIHVLKGLKIKTNWGTHFIRKGLVTSQFVISVTLIICTLIIYQQILHTQNRDLGINKNHLITLNKQLISVQKNGDLGHSFSTIKNDLMGTGYIQNACLSNGSAFSIGSSSADFAWVGKSPDQHVLIQMEWATPELVQTMGMRLIAGRDFYQDGSLDSGSVLINQSFAQLIDKDPMKCIGKMLNRNNSQLQIVGVVSDFVVNNLFGSPEPLVIFHDREGNQAFTLTIRFKEGVNYTEALAKTETILKKYNPGYPFEYKFVDERFKEFFKGESLIGRLAGIFSGLAIFISCLGLFGLAAYTAERRIREIGIRKVLGASISQLTQLLSLDFMRLVGISCLLACPLAYWVMNRWLQGYEYKVSLAWWMFLVPAALALLIALITVSMQAIKASLANPIQAIRTE
jgi:putative ABC transport system permease protein